MIPKGSARGQIDRYAGLDLHDTLQVYGRVLGGWRQTAGILVGGGGGMPQECYSHAGCVIQRRPGRYVDQAQRGEVVRWDKSCVV